MSDGNPPAIDPVHDGGGLRETPREPAPRRALDPLIGRTLDGRFRLLEQIGRGGLSVVYRAARADGAEGAAAVKVLDELYGGASPIDHRFRQEATLLERLGGRGAARALGTGMVDGRPYLALELLLGELLSERLRRGRVAPGEAAAIASALLVALGPAHELGVVHRDVKPAHVMIRGATVKLLDFGAAGGDSRAGPGRGELTPVPLGTPAYSAPEQGERPECDARADLYAVGVILFEMLCGRRPFVGDPIDVLRAHARTPPPRPRVIAPSLSSEIEAVILRALAKDPAARFGSADEMRAALAATPEAARAKEPT